MTGRITRITRIGFEIRTEITTSDQIVTVTLTRNEFLSLNFEVGSAVQVRVAPQTGPTASDRSEILRATRHPNRAADTVEVTG